MAESEYLKRPDAAGYLRVLEALQFWDPIGVLSDPACPRDEYDVYAAPIVRLLDRGVSAEQLMRVLRHIAREEMCIESNAERDAKVAADLVAFGRDWNRT
ncbi:MAG: hypothetical protein KA383_15295 [Phycisphaerae bacterium]|nr:hypothetical protein [Phycisphaerae bacterium]